MSLILVFFMPHTDGAENCNAGTNCTLTSRKRKIIRKIAMGIALIRPVWKRLTSRTLHYIPLHYISRITLHPITIHLGITSHTLHHISLHYISHITLHPIKSHLGITSHHITLHPITSHLGITSRTPVVLSLEFWNKHRKICTFFMCITCIFLSRA